MTFLVSSAEVHVLVNIARYTAGATFHAPQLTTAYEFVWLLEGTGTWEILGPGGEVVESHPLAPGAIALARPGASERWVWDPVRPTSHAYVHFVLPAGVDPGEWPRSRPMSECPPMVALADSLFAIASAGEGVALARSGQVVGLMLELFLAKPTIAPVGRTSIVDRVAEYVRQTWIAGGVRIIGISELANAAGVSPGHLSRSFHDQYAIGPARALELIRLGRVAVALHRTSTLLAEIARTNGFTDEYHMSKRFARVYGVPPGSYRRRHLEDEPLQPILTAQLMPLWNALLTHTPRA